MNRYYFFDTSAFVKAYVYEKGERWVRGIVQGAVHNPPSWRVVVTDLTFVEAISSLQRKYDAREIPATTYSAAVRHLEELLTPAVLNPYLVVNVSGVWVL